MSKNTKGGRRARRISKRTPDRPKPVAIYHDMRVEEDFETAAQRMFSLVRRAEQVTPGAPRYFYLDIQGHRNDVGGFDRDAFELMQDFLVGFLGEYLTEIRIPLGTYRRKTPQCNEVPEALGVVLPPDASTTAFDVNTLAIRPR